MLFTCCSRAPSKWGRLTASSLSFLPLTVHHTRFVSQLAKPLARTQCCVFSSPLPAPLLLPLIAPLNNALIHATSPSCSYTRSYTREPPTRWSRRPQTSCTEPMAPVSTSETTRCVLPASRTRRVHELSNSFLVLDPVQAEVKDIANLAERRKEREFEGLRKEVETLQRKLEEVGKLGGGGGQVIMTEKEEKKFRREMGWTNDGWEKSVSRRRLLRWAARPALVASAGSSSSRPS